MKSLNWSKIPTARIVGKENLWSMVAEEHSGTSNDLDFDVMECLFCQQTTSNSSPGQTSPPTGAKDPERKKKDLQEINLLDGKRSLNVNIFLKQFRSSHENIIKFVKEGIHEELGSERLRGLLNILPEPDEIEMLKNFDGDKAKLGKAEKFILQLIEVPSYKLRIESMLLKEEFEDSQDYLETSIETIRSAATEIENCRKLHEVLYMVLVAGNFLNAGGYAGNAAGFKMLSLLKLTEIRANKPSMTLIHYIAEQTGRKNSNLLQFTDEMHNLEEASKISMDNLQADTSSLVQRVSCISRQVASGEPDVKTQMHEFLQFANDKVDVIQKKLRDLENARKELGNFLCEDMETFKLEDSFKVFHSFCTRFKAAIQENEKRKHQEAMAEARRKQREEQLAMKRRSIEVTDNRCNGTYNHRDQIMDQLLGDIRSGFPERRFGELRYKNNINEYPEAATEPCKGGNLSPTGCVTSNTANGSSGAGNGIPCADGEVTEETQEEFPASSLSRKRLRNVDEPDASLIGYLRNSSESENLNRRSWGSGEGSSLERAPARRSSRKKKWELYNGETNDRERPASPPPPPVLPSDEMRSMSLEWQSKQQLRAKINQWMAQNEKEQERERHLREKFYAERLKRSKDARNHEQINYLKRENGQPVTPNLETLHEVNATTAACYKSRKMSPRNDLGLKGDVSVIGNNSKTNPSTCDDFHHSESHPGKAQGSVRDICEMFNSKSAKHLITASDSRVSRCTSPAWENVTLDESAFSRVRAYCSGRRLEKRAEPADMQTDRTRDDINVAYDSHCNRVTPTPNINSSRTCPSPASPCDAISEVESKAYAVQDSKVLNGSDSEQSPPVQNEELPPEFDRFSAARKTQRRRKLRQMRLEAENTRNAMTSLQTKDMQSQRSEYPVICNSASPELLPLTEMKTDKFGSRQLERNGSIDSENNVTSFECKTECKPQDDVSQKNVRDGDKTLNADFLKDTTNKKNITYDDDEDVCNRNEPTSGSTEIDMNRELSKAVDNVPNANEAVCSDQPTRTSGSDEASAVSEGTEFLENKSRSSIRSRQSRLNRRLNSLSLKSSASASEEKTSIKNQNSSEREKEAKKTGIQDDMRSEIPLPSKRTETDCKKTICKTNLREVSISSKTLVTGACDTPCSSIRDKDVSFNKANEANTYGLQSGEQGNVKSSLGGINSGESEAPQPSTSKQNFRNNGNTKPSAVLPEANVNNTNEGSTIKNPSNSGGRRYVHRVTVNTKTQSKISLPSSRLNQKSKLSPEVPRNQSCTDSAAKNTKSNVNINIHTTQTDNATKTKASALTRPKQTQVSSTKLPLSKKTDSPKSIPKGQIRKVAKDTTLLNLPATASPRLNRSHSSSLSSLGPSQKYGGSVRGRKPVVTQEKLGESSRIANQNHINTSEPTSSAAAHPGSSSIVATNVSNRGNQTKTLIKTLISESQKTLINGHLDTGNGILKSPRTTKVSLNKTIQIQSRQPSLKPPSIIPKKLKASGS